jgi:hypothetical protein
MAKINMCREMSVLHSLKFYYLIISYLYMFQLKFQDVDYQCVL